MAKRHLEMRGHTTYLPLLAEMRLRRRRRVEIITPLFPMYLFLIVADQRWADARTAPGVSRILCDGDGPSPVPEAMITGLRNSEYDGLIRLPEKPLRLRRGAQVRIVGASAFAGRLAIFQGMTSAQRTLVLLSWLGAQREVSLPAADVEPV